MDLYINNQDAISYGQPIHEEARQLSEYEKGLYLRGYGYEIQDGFLIDVLQSSEYKAEQEQKLSEEKAKRKITKRQLLIWLYINKQKEEDDILAAINMISDPAQKYLAKVNYQGTNDFYFGNEFVPVIGLSLGLTAVELDTMFDEAGGL